MKACTKCIIREYRIPPVVVLIHSAEPADVLELIRVDHFTPKLVKFRFGLHTIHASVP